MKTKMGAGTPYSHRRRLPIGGLQHLVIQINRLCSTCRKVSMSVVSDPLTRRMDLDGMTPVDFKSCRKEARKRLGTRAQKANYERSADTETYIDSRLHNSSVPHSVTAVLLHSAF